MEPANGLMVIFEKNRRAWLRRQKRQLEDDKNERNRASLDDHLSYKSQKTLSEATQGLRKPYGRTLWPKTTEFTRFYAENT